MDWVWCCSLSWNPLDDITMRWSKAVLLLLKVLISWQESCNCLFESSFFIKLKYSSLCLPPIYSYFAFWNILEHKLSTNLFKTLEVTYHISYNLLSRLKFPTIEMPTCLGYWFIPLWHKENTKYLYPYIAIDWPCVT